MNITIKDQGFQDLASKLYGMAKESKTARRAALKDVGSMIRKQLIKNRNTGAGMPPLGYVSRILGNKKPWGKKKFNVYVPKNASVNPFVVVTTKGANKNIENGGWVNVSRKLRGFLHFKNVHLRGKNPLKMRIPPRPLFKITWEQVKGQIGKLYNDRFMYQLGRATRGRIYRNAERI